MVGDAGDIWFSEARRSSGISMIVLHHHSIIAVIKLAHVSTEANIVESNIILVLELMLPQTESLLIIVSASRFLSWHITRSSC